MVSIGIMSFLLITASSPIIISLALLLLSIVMSILMIKVTGSMWIPGILVITFSSGMMTLFMYATSLAPNGITKLVKLPLVFVLMMFFAIPNSTHEVKTSNMMKNFSSYSSMVIMTIILLMTLMSMSSNAHSPHQSLISSY